MTTRPRGLISRTWARLRRTLGLAPRFPLSREEMLETVEWLNQGNAASGRGRGSWPQPCGACRYLLLRPEDALLESRLDGDDLREPRIIHSDEASPFGGCGRAGEVTLYPLPWFLGTEIAQWFWRNQTRQGAAQPEWSQLALALGQWDAPALLTSTEADPAVH